MARTAAIAGTATAVSNRVSRRQYNRWSQQSDQQPEPEPAPAPAAAAPAPQPDRMEQLKQLGELKAQGVLTEQEFAAEKAKILNQ
jgi:hypothetical protein